MKYDLKRLDQVYCKLIKRYQQRQKQIDSLIDQIKNTSNKNVSSAHAYNPIDGWILYEIIGPKKNFPSKIQNKTFLDYIPRKPKNLELGNQLRLLERNQGLFF
jgi:hypothetical protein